MKKIFLVESIDNIDREDFIECVVIANNFDEVYEILFKEYNFEDFGSFTVKEIFLNSNDSEILSIKFNYG